MVKLNNCNSFDSGGHGFDLTGDVEATNCNAFNSGGAGFKAQSKLEVFTQLGLPADTDPSQIASLLRELLLERRERRAAVVASSPLIQRVVNGGSKLAELTSNILSIFDSDTVHNMLDALAT